MPDAIGKRLRRFFRTQLDRAKERGRDCLEDEQIAAFVDHTLAPTERARVEVHLADCEFCLGQVAFLVRLKETPIPEAAPAALIAQASEGASVEARPWFAWAWRWEAAAAMVACAVVMLVISLREASRQVRVVSPAPRGEVAAARVPAPAETNPLVPLASAPARAGVQLRGGTPTLSTPTLLFPAPHATLLRSQAEFRWQSVPGASGYEVRLLTAEGDLVWEKRTEASSVKVPADVKLAAGQNYYVSVRADLPEGKTAQSRVVAFRVADHN